MSCFVLAGTAPLEAASSPFIKKKQKADPKGAVRADEDWAELIGCIFQ